MDMAGISYSINGGFSFKFLSIGIGIMGDKRGIAGVSLSVGVGLYKYGGYGAFVVAAVIPIKIYGIPVKSKAQNLMRQLRYTFSMRYNNRYYRKSRW